MNSKEQIKQLALDFLRKNFTGTVATANLNSEPFSSTVYFAVKDDFTIYFTTSHTTNKFKNIVLNPKAAFSVGVGPEYKTFQMRGSAKVLYEKDQEEGLALLAEIQKFHPLEEWPIKAISKLKEGGSALVQITPTNVSYLDLTVSRAVDESPMYQLLP